MYRAVPISQATDRWADVKVEALKRQRMYWANSGETNNFCNLAVAVVKSHLLNNLEIQIVGVIKYVSLQGAERMEPHNVNERFHVV